MEKETVYLFILLCAGFICTIEYMETQDISWRGGISAVVYVAILLRELIHWIAIPILQGKI